MVDNMSREHRSYTMSRIRSRSNKTTEERLVKILRTHGIKGWRRRVDLPGKPDFVFPQQKLVVFVDGCFWHGCPRCKLRPKTNTDYWTKKIQGNRKQDLKIKNQLRKMEWIVMRVWEHALGHPETISQTIKKLLKAL